MRACPPYEMEHLSEEFTNGSSADATGNRRRFQAENLRQITIYQLMKPLKITPPHPHRTTILLCPLSSTLHYLRKHWLHSEERIWHDSHSSLFMLIFFNKTMAKERRYLRAVFAIDTKQYSFKERYTNPAWQQIFFFCFLQSAKKKGLN